MEGKDDRSKSKRSKMKQHNYRKATRNSVSTAGRTSSSSQHEEVVRSVVDVADSSDDRFGSRQNWMRSSGGVLQPQPSIDDTLDEFDNIDNEQLRAPDFELMAQLPASSGGYFKFSSEKSWEDGEEKQLASQYFTLNLKLLNIGLQSIPFYKRMDYPTSMFTNAQLKTMEQKATAAEQHYQQVLKEHLENQQNKNHSSSSRTGSAQTVVNGGSSITDDIKKLSLENDTGKENAHTNDIQDTQQWLDNLLEE